MGVTLFLKNEGILRAIAYGAQKTTGKLRILTRLFLYGEYLLDFGNSNIRIMECIPKDELRKSTLSVEQLYIVSIWAECLYTMHRAEEHTQTLFALFDRAYTQLLDAEQGTELLIHVLCMWRMVYLFGIGPEIIENHRHFNRKLLEFESRQHADTMTVSPACMKVLKLCSVHRFEILKTRDLSQSALREAWDIVKIILNDTIGYTLKSIMVSHSLL